MKVRNHNRILANRSGSTLIEILVTIFVLTAGLFVLYGMFPQGFTILSNSQKINTASGLLQSNVTALQMRDNNMPFAIVPCDNDGNADGNILLGDGTSKSASSINPNLLADDSFERDSDGKYKKSASDEYMRGSLLRSRKVVGEKVAIPGGDYVTTANGSLYGGKYTLLFSPIDTTRGSDGKLKRFRVVGPGMTKVDEFASSNYPMNEIWDDSEFGCYYNESDARLYFAFLPSKVYTSMDYSQVLDYDRKYAVSYMVRNDTTGQVFKKNGSIVVKKDYDGKWQTTFYDYDENDPTANDNNMTNIGTGNTFLADTLVVNRVFEEITDGNFGRDPYQFVMADPIVGTIVFNPLGSALQFKNAGEKTSLVASIDYLIYDPRIIVQDFQFPANADYDGTVKLKLFTNGILSVGNPDILGDGTNTKNPDEMTFEGLIRGNYDPATGSVDLSVGKRVTDISDIVIPQSVLIIDLSTGLRVFPADTAKEDISIDFKNGSIGFKSEKVNLISWKDGVDKPVYSNLDIRNRVIRVYYRTQADWILKICKTPSVFSDSGNGANNYNTSVDLLWDEYGFNSGTPDNIYLPQSYSGMDVYVDYVDSDGNNIYGELHKISDFPEDNDVSCYVKLKNEADTILSVRGSGANIGAFWRDGQKFKNRQINFSIIGQ